MDNQVVRMLGIDQGKRFVFCCGLQIDLWTELRAKKLSKNTFFWGLDRQIGYKFPGPLGFFSLAREYLEVGVRFSYTARNGQFTLDMNGTFGRKFFRIGDTGMVENAFFWGVWTPK